MKENQNVRTMSDTQVLRALYEELGFEVRNHENGQMVVVQRDGQEFVALLCSSAMLQLAAEHRVNLQWYMDSPEVSAYQHGKAQSTFSYQDTSRERAMCRAIAQCLILTMQRERSVHEYNTSPNGSGD